MLKSIFETLKKSRNSKNSKMENKRKFWSGKKQIGDKTLNLETKLQAFHSKGTYEMEQNFKIGTKLHHLSITP